MVAKPYSPSHIGAVAAHYTEMRLSGAVKERLVELLCEELDRLVPTMEEETLTQDPERKTLDDPNRSRLNYNRTRELMIDRIDAIDSVGSAAVQAGIEHIEKHLAKLLRHAERPLQEIVSTPSNLGIWTTQSLGSDSKMKVKPSHSKETKKQPPMISSPAKAVALSLLHPCFPWLEALQK